MLQGLLWALTVFFNERYSSERAEEWERKGENELETTTTKTRSRSGERICDGVRDTSSFRCHTFNEENDGRNRILFHCC